MSKYPNWPIVMLTNMVYTSQAVIDLLARHEIPSVWSIAVGQGPKMRLRFKTATDAAMASLLITNETFLVEGGAYWSHHWLTMSTSGITDESELQDAD